jgi:hypothetical protein
MYAIITLETAAVDTPTKGAIFITNAHKNLASLKI